jgi:sialic acid synthase SpsE
MHAEEWGILILPLKCTSSYPAPIDEAMCMVKI